MHNTAGCEHLPEAIVLDINGLNPKICTMSKVRKMVKENDHPRLIY